VLCAHGTRGSAGAVRRHAAALGRRRLGGEVGACALYGEPKLERWLDGLVAPRARLVPFMMAEGYTLDRLRERVAAHPEGDRVEIVRAVGAHPALTGLIAATARAGCAAAGWPSAGTALLLVGHGTKRHAASTRTAEAHARRLAEGAGFAQVATAYLDDDPQVPDAVRALAAPRCVAVGFFTDAGDHGRDDVPALLAEADRPARYAGPIGPQDAIQDVILQQAQAAEVAPSVLAAEEVGA
jgi:sirohydrochlorin cobaltochelatase